MKRMFDSIIFCGLDGSGKSTQAKKLIEALKSNNIQCRYVWLRYPNVLSLPFAAFVKLLGKSVYPLSIERRKKGISNLRENNFLQKLWEFVLFSDLKFVSSYKVFQYIKKGDIVILDRYIIDSVIDLAVTSDKEEKIIELYDKFSKILPYNTKIFYFDIDAQTSFQRVHEEDVKTLEIKRKLYLILSKKFQFTVINGNDSISDIHNTILEECTKN